MKRTITVLLLVGVFGSMSACGMKPKKHYQGMRTHLLNRDFDAAVQHIDKAKGKVYGDKEKLLYFMDKGTVLHLAKRYRESNAVLENAKQTAEDLWTESIGSNAAAWMTTDNSLPYQGEDFEKVLIHFIAALNYVDQGDYSAARVEARQITDKLELYNSKRVDKKSVYRDDAFARWLAGKLRETEGGRRGWNEAWIDYQRAIEVYEADYAKRYRTGLPRMVVADALRVLDALGRDFATEFQQLRAKYPSIRFTPQAELEGKGEVVFLHLAGEAPYKVDKFWNVYSNDAVWIEASRSHGKGKVVVGRTGRKLQFRVAYPEYVARKAQITRAKVSAAGGSASTEMLEPVTAIAVQNLNDHMARIKSKALVRAATKFIAAKVAQEGGKSLAKKEGKAGAAGVGLFLAGAALQVGSAIAEEADKRSWTTLPAMVNAASLWLPAGDHQLQIALQSQNGGTVQTVTLPVKVVPGKATIVAYRTFR